MKDWLKPTRSTADMGRVILDVEGATCEVEEHTKSRFNVMNVLAVAEILVWYFENGGYASEDICVLTPYKTQKTKLY